MTEVIAQIRRGDPDALASLMSRYQHRLYRYLVRLARDPATAEDLFQQTWLRVYEKIGQFDFARNFDVWLFSVAHNLAVDYFRGRRATESLDARMESGSTRAEHLAAAGPDALAQLLDSERTAMLAACMGELSPIHREVLTLRFEENMKLEEIAEVARIPLSTVKSRLSRALEGLRSAVQSRFLGRREV
jgi:RNA polymerase sigma-70 factor, ECF subfamily